MIAKFMSENQCIFLLSPLFKPSVRKAAGLSAPGFKDLDEQGQTNGF